MSPRVRAALGFHSRNIEKMTSGARNIHAKLSENPQLFPSPTPTLVAFLGLVTSLEDAQPPVKSGTKGASLTRNNRARALTGGLQQTLSYVQALADASPDHAEAIIIAAGMTIYALPQFPKPPVTLVNSRPLGTVLLRANVAMLTGGTRKAVLYTWQYSVDGNEETWITLPVTAIGRSTITGLAPKTTVSARVAVTVRDQPMGPWSPVATLIVV